MKVVAAALLSLMLSTVAFARWADPSVANLVMEVMQNHIDVKEDGTFVMNGEMVVKFLTEASISGRSQFTQQYSRATEKFEILEAETLLADKKIPVPEEMIEDRAVASSASGMEDLHQVSITFPSLAKGAKIHFKFRVTVLQKAAPGFFSYLTAFNKNENVRKWETTIRAPFPLFVESHNPGGMFDLKASKDGDAHLVSIKLKAPYFRAVVEEDDMTFVPEDAPWVHVVNSQDWNVPFQTIANGFETEISKPLPPQFEKILALAKKIPPGSKQLNAITDQLSDSLRYVSDTRKMEGMLAPRKLTTFIDTGYGDCKDFATAIVAMTRRLGYDSNIAIVESSVERSSPMGKFPAPSYFNHAIARVKIDEKVYWLDGTGNQSFAEGVRTSWQDRNALVLDPKKPFLQWIPAMGADRNRWTVKKEYVLDAKKTIVPFKQSVTATGNYALHYVGVDRMQEQSLTQYHILGQLEDVTKILDYKFAKLDLGSRSYHDVKVDVSGTLEKPFMRTSAGHAYNWVSGTMIERLLRPVRNRVSHLDLEMKSTQDYEFLLRNARLVGKPMRCDVSSPWFEGTRLISQEREGVRMQDKFVVKTDVVKIAELNSKPYREFQSRLETCFSSVAVLFKVGRGTSVPLAR